MKMITQTKLLALLFVLLATFTTAPAHAAPEIVSVEWLSQHLNDANLVLFHVGEKTGFDQAHIPNAQYITLRDISVTRDNGKINTELPPAEELRKTLEKFGARNNSRIVLYFGKDWVSPTTRVYFTLDYLGLAKQTALLDGGMPAWIAAGKPTTTEIKTPASGALKVKPNKDLVADAEWLRAQLRNSAVSVVDARDTNFYDGTSVGNRPRAGHIAGARTIPYESLFTDDNKLKDTAALRKIFADAGVKPGDTVVSYCHVGQQATVVYFASKSLGYKAKVYDGSFEEWSERAALPVDDPQATTRGTTIQLVSPEWMAARTGDANLRILDVRNNVYDYFVAHVPNAVHLADAGLRAPRNGYPTQYLDTFVTSRLLSNAGVKKEDRVVLYSEGASVLGATMTAYILERLGHKQIYILDGGWAAYKDTQKTSKEYPQYDSNAGYDVWDNRAPRATLDDVKAALSAGKVKFVDPRPTDNYTGEVTTWVRNGHIPGALSVPWKTLMDDANPHKLKPLPSIRRAYADAGLTPESDIIVYCGTSREASLEYIILKHLLGFPKVRLYEGSWAEYATYPELKIETGAGKAASR